VLPSVQQEKADGVYSSRYFSQDHRRYPPLQAVPSLVTYSVFIFAQNQFAFGSTVRRCGAQRGAREMANLRTTAQTQAEEHFRKVFNREMTPEERRIVFIMLDDEPYPSSCWRQHSPQRLQRGRRFRSS
jgi:hypothetical protein